MEVMSAREAAEKWGISQRRVAVLCSENRIDNATMVGNMWIIVENTCPVINRISPAALISRAFYTLGIQDNLNQYYQCILTLVGISALFCLGGFLLTRRKRYASI